MRKPSPLLALLGGVAITLAVACGGDDKNESSAGAAANDTSGASSAAAAPLNLSTSANNIAALKSFRFDLAIKLDIPMPASTGSSDDALGAALGGALLGVLGDIRAEGALVSPDQVEMKMNMAGQEFGYVQIGDDAWVKFGSTWQETTASASAMDFTSPTDLFTDLLPAQAIAGAKTSQETVNGVKTTRYSFDKQALEKLLEEMEDSPTGMGELTSAQMDVWMTAENIPAKLQLDFAGTDETGQKMAMKMEMNLRDINSDSIRIRPPV